jgi:hypothetical protein
MPPEYQWKKKAKNMFPAKKVLHEKLRLYQLNSRQEPQNSLKQDQAWDLNILL